MKSYELKPTEQNLMNTYTKDSIDRNAALHRFVKMLNSVNDCCSIALDGAWGSGKTFFVKQAKMILDAHNEHIFCSSIPEYHKKDIKEKWEELHKNNPVDLQPQVCIYYDAWENDNDDDPVLSLICTILENVKSDFSFDDKNYFDNFLAVIDFLDILHGRNLMKLKEELTNKSQLTAIKQRKDLREKIKEFFESLLPEAGNRLIIFIDELDRCRPDYAVTLLERIKHYFQDDRITFVFSTNIYELQHTIKQCYGSDFNACRYLDRFFDLRFELPRPNMQKYLKSINFDYINCTFDQVCHEVINIYKFELREVEKFCRLIKIAAYTPTHSSKFPLDFEYRMGLDTARSNALSFGLHYVLPVMVGLKIYDMRKYNEFIAGKDPTPLLEIAERLHNEDYFDELINGDETFSKENLNGKFVQLKNRVKEAYDALFVLNYKNIADGKIVGKCRFCEIVTIKINEVTSLLSDYADFDLEDK